MPRPTKIREARTPAEYRDAVVERYRKIRSRREPVPLFVSPDQPPPPPRRADGGRDDSSGGRGLFSRVTRPDDDDDNL